MCAAASAEAAPLKLWPSLANAASRFPNQMTVCIVHHGNGAFLIEETETVQSVFPDQTQLPFGFADGALRPIDFSDVARDGRSADHLALVIPDGRNGHGNFNWCAV